LLGIGLIGVIGRAPKTTSLPVGVSVLAVVKDSTLDFLVVNAPVHRVTNVRLGEVGIITQIGTLLQPLAASTDRHHRASWPA
jgi:hypothetical protein